MVAPGQTVIHNELWEIFEALDVLFIPTEIQKLIINKKELSK